MKQKFPFQYFFATLLGGDNFFPNIFFIILLSPAGLAQQRDRAAG